MSKNLEKLYDLISSRKSQKTDDKSYVKSLFGKGKHKISQKLGEEAVELVIAATKCDKQEIISETSDLLFHLLILLVEHDVSLKDVYDELKKREGKSGIEEKLSRKK